MIRRVWERCGAARLEARIVVATDDERIAAEVASFGGEAVMTPPELASGSERMAWVAERMEGEVFINVQGDEPLLPPSTIDATAEALAASDAEIATAACPLRDPAAFFNPNVVKLVTDAAGNALYFSRAPIPHDRDAAATEPENGNGFGNGGVYSEQIGIHPMNVGIHRKHIGIYAFRREALRRFAALPPGRLEQLEKLEQLRALEHGLRIRVADVAADSQAVDTPEDLRLVEDLLNNEIP